MKALAYVLIGTECRSSQDTFRRLCDIPGVKSAHQTTGRWDAVLCVEAGDFHEIPKMVLEKVRRIEGVRETETLFAFDRL